MELARHHPARVIRQLAMDEFGPAELSLDHPARVMCRTSQTAIFGHVTERCDVIIVGSGAGGGTLAHTLAPSGKILALLAAPAQITTMSAS